MMVYLTSPTIYIVNKYPHRCHHHSFHLLRNSYRIYHSSVVVGSRWQMPSWIRDRCTSSVYVTRAAAYYILNATSIEFTEYGAGGGIYIMFFVVRDGVVTNPHTLLQSIRRCARRGVYNIMRCRGIRLRGGLNIHDGWYIWRSLIVILSGGVQEPS